MDYQEALAIYNLISERYHKLLRAPDTRDEEVFLHLEGLYQKYKRIVLEMERNGQAKQMAYQRGG